MLNYYRNERVQDCSALIDLGLHSFADLFIPENSEFQEPLIPLQVGLDDGIGLFQLLHLSHPLERYNILPYSYRSANSISTRAHWSNFYLFLVDRIGLKAKTVCEIGFNDGFLLSLFSENSELLCGIDASSELCDHAKNKFDHVYSGVFDENLAAEVLSETGAYDLVIANNVVNHANDPVIFFRAVSALLEDDGAFVFEVPSWHKMMISARFPDMIYHEHISYFTVDSILTCLREAALEIKSIQLVDSHGGSYRVVAQKATGALKLSCKIANSLSEGEKQAGIYETAFYSNKQEQIDAYRDHWLKQFTQKIRNHDSVIGIGAAAKANTWLTWMGLSQRELMYITDSCESKIGKRTPVTKIPIKSDEILRDLDAPLCIILAWNFSTSLREKLKTLNPNIEFMEQ